MGRGSREGRGKHTQEGKRAWAPGRPPAAAPAPPPPPPRPARGWGWERSLVAGPAPGGGLFVRPVMPTVSVQGHSFPLAAGKPKLAFTYA